MPKTEITRSSEPSRGLRVRAARESHVRGHILFAFAIALLLALAYVMRDTLFLLYVSALFAVVLNPLVEAILHVHVGRWSPGRSLAIALLLLGVAGGATLFLTFVVPPILSDLRQFAENLPQRGPQMLKHLRELPFSSRLNLNDLFTKLQGSASSLAEYIFLSLSGWASKVVDIAAVVILTIYFMLEGSTAYTWALSFFPRRLRPRLDGALLRAEVRMGRWLLGQGALMLILGVLSIIVFALLRIRYAYALGVVMGLFNIIPILGGLVSIALVVLVAAMDSWGKALGALVFYLVYTQIENSYLTPRIMRSSVNLSALAVLVALLIGTKVAGIVGAMVAVPTAVLVSVLVQEYLLQKDAAQTGPEEGRSEGVQPV